MKPWTIERMHWNNRWRGGRRTKWYLPTWRIYLSRFDCIYFIQTKTIQIKIKTINSSFFIDLFSILFTSDFMFDDWSPEFFDNSEFSVWLIVTTKFKSTSAARGLWELPFEPLPVFIASHRVDHFQSGLRYSAFPHI